MKDDILSQLFLLPVKLATDNPDSLMLIGDRREELTKEEAIYLTNTMEIVIKKIVENIVTDVKKELPKDINEIKDNLLKAFTYCFDKSIEIVYNLRAEVDAEIDFNFSDMYEGGGGDAVPEYIQLKVTPCIKMVSTIFIKLIEFITANKESYLDKGISINELTKATLFGGMTLGIELCLRMDLDNYNEIDKYLGV